MEKTITVRKNKKLSVVAFNIMCLRKIHSLTQDEFSKALSISRPMSGAWEEGRCLPTLEALVKVSIRFNVTTDDLLKKILFPDFIQ